MTSDVALGFGMNLLWHAMLIAGPIMLATLIVGLVISILQVVTQIQEVTLTYIPKMLAVGATLLLAGGWMLNTLMNYAALTIACIPHFV